MRETLQVNLTRASSEYLQTEKHFLTQLKMVIKLNI